MDKNRYRVKIVGTIFIALLCGTLALLWPQWRQELEAKYGPYGPYGPPKPPPGHLLDFPGSKVLITGGVVESPAMSHDLLLLEFDPGSNTLYGVTGCCPNQFVIVDPVTGGLTPLSNVGDMSFGFSAASSLNPQTHQFYLNRYRQDTGSGHLISINIQTGGVVESPAMSHDLLLLEFDPGSNTLYGVTSCCPNQFVIVDPITGGLTPLSNVGDMSFGFSAASSLNPQTHQFYLSRYNQDTGSWHLISINTQSGPNPVEMMKMQSTTYVYKIILNADFDCTKGVLDAVPPLFNVLAVDASCGISDYFKDENGRISNIAWDLDGCDNGISQSITVALETNQKPGSPRKPPTYEPKDCGPVYLNEGAYLINPLTLYAESKPSNSLFVAACLNESDIIGCVDYDIDGWAYDCGDCDDLDPTINPDAEEVCGDGIDNNCDGQIDEGCDL